MASSSLQICALLVALAGFCTLVVTTMSSRWKVLDTTAELVTADWVSEGLWMDCAATALGSVECKKILYMLNSDPHVQACRALMITSILLGFLAAVLSLLGMKCTNIGLSDEDGKMKFTVTGGFLFILAGLCSMVAVSWYAAMVTAQFFNKLYLGTKLFQTQLFLFFGTNSLSMNFLDWTRRFPERYELGEGLYLGWAGSTLYILGGILLTCSCRGNEKPNYSPNKYTYTAAQAGPQPHTYLRSSETVISNKEYV